MRTRLFETLVLSRTADPGRRTRLSWPLSLGVHALGVAALLSVPYWTAAELPEPKSVPATPALSPALVHIAPRPQPTPAPAPPPRRRSESTLPAARTPGPSIAVPRQDPDGLPAADSGPAPDPRALFVDGGACPECTGPVGADDVGGGLPGPDTGGPTLVRLSERDIRAPRKLHNVAPRYPELALRARVQGRVVVECTIDTHGRIIDVRAVSGHPLLDGAALEAVGQWIYTPTLLDGVPVSVLMTVTVNFNLAR